MRPSDSPLKLAPFHSCVSRGAAAAVGPSFTHTSTGATHGNFTPAAAGRPFTHAPTRAIASDTVNPAAVAGRPHSRISRRYTWHLHPCRCSRQPVHSRISRGTAEQPCMCSAHAGGLPPHMGGIHLSRLRVLLPRCRAWRSSLEEEDAELGLAAAWLRFEGPAAASVTSSSLLALNFSCGCIASLYTFALWIDVKDFVSLWPWFVECGRDSHMMHTYYAMHTSPLEHRSLKPREFIPVLLTCIPPTILASCLSGRYLVVDPPPSLRFERECAGHS